MESLSQEEIAEAVGCNRSTLCRELKRNKSKKGYRYKKAQGKADGLLNADEEECEELALKNEELEREQQRLRGRIERLERETRNRRSYS